MCIALTVRIRDIELIKYENPPSREELIELAKRALANMGYDTPEKRKQWYESQKPIWFLCTRYNKE